MNTHALFFCLLSRLELQRCRYKLAWDRRKEEWPMTSGGGISIWLSTLASMAFSDTHKHTSKQGSKFSPRLSSSNATIRQRQITKLPGLMISGSLGSLKRQPNRCDWLQHFLRLERRKWAKVFGCFCCWWTALLNSSYRASWLLFCLLIKFWPKQKL